MDRVDCRVELRRRAAGRAILRVVALVALAAFVVPGLHAQGPREVHGAGDAYSEAGVVLAWAVLRGQSEAATTVVVHIAADPQRYAVVSALASNPFSQRKQALLAPTPTGSVVELRVPRAQFADLPRSELRFYASTSDAQVDAPSLVVFYLGVPDTTPEFAAEAAMNAYLADRLARAGSGGKAP